jgi:hypothetical protein
MNKPLFFFLQKGSKAFWVQNFISKAMENKSGWVTDTFPFIGTEKNPGNYLSLHYNGIKIKVGSRNYGIRLFYFTKQTILNTIELTEMAHELKDEMISHDCPINIELVDNNLFMYDKSCVWNNIVSEDNCYDMIHHELDMEDFVPSIWQEHRETLGKYFFPHNLTENQAEILYAPVEELKPHIVRTPQLIQAIEERRNTRDYEVRLLQNIGSNMNPMDDIIEQVQLIQFTPDLETANVSAGENNKKTKKLKTIVRELIPQKSCVLLSNTTYH